MNYESVLAIYREPTISAAIQDSLNRLFQHDLALLTINASEQAIAAQLAQYLKPHFLGYDVDVEYNRMGDKPKMVMWLNAPDAVYPDIIVHKRTTTTNILTIVTGHFKSRHFRALQNPPLQRYITILSFPVFFASRKLFPLIVKIIEFSRNRSRMAAVAALSPSIAAQSDTMRLVAMMVEPFRCLR